MRAVHLAYDLTKPSKMESYVQGSPKRRMIRFLLERAPSNNTRRSQSNSSLDPMPLSEAWYRLFAHAPNFSYIFQYRILLQFQPRPSLHPKLMRQMRQQQLREYILTIYHQWHQRGNSYHIAKVTSSRTSLL